MKCKTWYKKFVKHKKRNYFFLSQKKWNFIFLWHVIIFVVATWEQKYIKNTPWHYSKQCLKQKFDAARKTTLRQNKKFDVAQNIIWCRQKQLDVARKIVLRQTKKSRYCTKKYFMSLKTRWCCIKKLFCAQKVISFFQNGAP